MHVDQPNPTTQEWVVTQRDGVRADFEHRHERPMVLNSAGKVESDRS